MPIFIDLVDNFPFFGVLFAIILLSGIYQIGNYVLHFYSINKIFSAISNVDCQKIFVGINVVLFLLYPIVLFLDSSKFIIKNLTILIFFIGLIKLLILVNNYKFLYKNISIDRKHLDEYLLYLIIFSLFLLSLAPNTHADSLDYHFTAAKHIIEYGTLSTDLTHFHSRLVGSGEIIIAMGLVFGSEQFGSLVQFSGLISLFGIFLKFKHKNNYIFMLLILTSPVVLFLSSTSKPQLFHICASAVALSLCLFDRKVIFNRKNEIIKCGIILFILFISYQVKFSFILSTFLIGLIVFYKSIKKKIYIEFFLIVAGLFVLIYLPPFFWKIKYFGGNVIEYLYSPLPISIPGMIEFKHYLTSVGAHHNLLNIIIPRNLGEFTNSLGVGVFFIFLVNYKKNNDAKIILILIFIFIIISLNLGQRTARFFLEPFYWTMVSCIYFGTWKNFKLFNILCKAQVVLIIPMIFYGIIFLSSGSLTSNMKHDVLKKNANGYSLFKWSNSIISESEPIISTHRSISYGKSKTIPIDFIIFDVASDKNNNILIEEIKRINPKYLLDYGSKPVKNETLKNCIGALLQEKKKVGIHATRNPFNRSVSYNGYIYEFNANLLPGCLSKR